MHAKFLPALQGANTKMSASNTNSAIFMTDDPKTIAKKIKSHAFSGGGASREEHERDGGNPDIDVAYQYLSFFEDSDAKMEELANGYRAGTLSTSQMKEACIEKLQKIVGDFQAVGRPFFSLKESWLTESDAKQLRKRWYGIIRMERGPSTRLLRRGSGVGSAG
jgi:tryptophanyl-tRNA synthetase